MILSSNTCFTHRVQLLISRVDAPQRTTSPFVSFPSLRLVTEVAVIQRHSNTILQFVRRLEHLRSVCQFLHETRQRRLRDAQPEKYFDFENRASHLFSFRFGSMLGFPSILSIKTRIRGENCFSVFLWYFDDGTLNSVLFLSDVLNKSKDTYVWDVSFYPME